MEDYPFTSELELHIFHRIRDGILDELTTYGHPENVLYHAAAVGDETVVRDILIALPQIVNMPNLRMHNSTALMAACLNSREHSRIVSLLLDHGADTTLRSDISAYGNTAFHWAAFRGAESPLEILVRHNPHGVTFLNQHGETPLTLARSMVGTASYDKHLPPELVNLDAGEKSDRRLRIIGILNQGDN
jgi:ankyrin repeat protein